MTKKLRILHLNASPAGGAFVAAQRLSESLNLLPNIASVHLVFEGQSGDYTLWSNSFFKRKIAFLKHAFEKLDFLRFEKDKSIRFAFSHAPFGIDVTEIPQFQNADIIHLHWVNKGFLSLNMIQKIIMSGKKIVWTNHDMWAFTGGCYHPRGCDHYLNQCGNCQYLKNPSNSDLSNTVFLKKSEIWGNSNLEFVTPSNWLKEKALISGIWKSNDVRISSIPNPIDVDFFREPTYEEQIQAKLALGLNTELPVIMFSAASLRNPKKGFQEFLNICNVLIGKGLQFQALILGDLKGLTLDLNFPHVHLGFVSDNMIIRSAYWSSKIYITTSHEENLPTTIMESLSCGLPVAAFEVGGIPEMILEGESGYLAPLLDVNKLANSVHTFLHLEKVLTEEMVRNCRNFAVQNYSSEEIAKEYVKIYSK